MFESDFAAPNSFAAFGARLLRLERLVFGQPNDKPSAQQNTVHPFDRTAEEEWDRMGEEQSDVYRLVIESIETDMINRKYSKKLIRAVLNRNTNDEECSIENYHGYLIWVSRWPDTGVIHVKNESDGSEDTYNNIVDFKTFLQRISQPVIDMYKKRVLRSSES